MNKAESVCTDRCVSKYMDLHDLIGKEITEFSMKLIRDRHLFGFISRNINNFNGTYKNYLKSI